MLEQEVLYTAAYFSHTAEKATKTFNDLHIGPSSTLELLHPSLTSGIDCNISWPSSLHHKCKVYVLINPKLNTRISGLLRPDFVTIRGPPLKSETGWTGEL